MAMEEESALFYNRASIESAAQRRNL